MSRGATVGDSLHPRTLDSVVVSATRDDPFVDPGAGVTPVAIAADDFALVIDALGPVPGVTLQRYGGAGMLATLALRGAPAGSTRVVIDGLALNAATSGTADLSLLPASLLQAAVVVPGPMTIDVDNDAGGIVHLSYPRADGRWSAHAAWTAGSFDERTATIAAAAPLGNALTAAAGLARTTARDDYPFTTDLGTGTRADADVSQTSAFLRVTGRHGPDDDRGHDVLLSTTWSDHGVPAAITGAVDNGSARQTDAVTSLVWNARWIDAQATSLATRAAFAYADEHYHDPAFLLSGEALDSRTIVRTAYAEASGAWRPTERLTWNAAVRQQLDAATATSLPDITRLTTDALLAADLRLGSSARPSILRASIHTLLWNDAILGAARSWQARANTALGALVPLNGALTVRLSGAFLVHRPVLNDLYWIPGGNPSLQPERSLTADAGVHATLAAWGDASADLSGWWRDTRDRILWQPGSDGVWMATNVDHVRSTGVDVTLRCAPVSGVELAFAEELASNVRVAARFPGDSAQHRELPYLPLEQTHVTATVTLAPWACVAFGVDHESHRFTSADNREFLPGHTVSRVAVTLRKPLGGLAWSATGACENLLDERYAIVAGYPMPPRTFHVTLSASWRE